MMRILVCGAAGKMGREVVKAILADAELTLVGGVDHSVSGQDIGTIVGIAPLGLPIFESLTAGLAATTPDVVVDFTSPVSVYEHAQRALSAGAHVVIGTTGLTAMQREELDAQSRKIGKNVLVAPNFSLGAVLMMKVSAELAQHFPDVEIIELHHNQKYDAPSGTAILTAQRIATARKEAGIMPSEDATRESIAGARGASVEEIPVHSVRLPGYVAHQQVLFGGHAETLSIRHDSLHRSSFMPGVVLACKKIANHPGLTYGLEHYL